jgi:hypothetical protein
LATVEDDIGGEMSFFIKFAWLAFLLSVANDDDDDDDDEEEEEGEDDEADDVPTEAMGPFPLVPPPPRP